MIDVVDQDELDDASAAPTAEDVEEAQLEAADEEEAPITGISFFADGPDHDERICKRVFDLYLRSSVEHGHEEDTSKRQELAPHLAAIQPGDTTITRTVQEEKTMASTKRGELQGLVKVAHAAFVRDNGRAPYADELFGYVGTVGKTPENVRMAAKRAGLAMSSRREAPTTIASPAPPTSPAPRPAMMPPPPAPDTVREPRRATVRRTKPAPVPTAAPAPVVTEPVKAAPLASLVRDAIRERATSFLSKAMRILES